MLRSAGFVALTLSLLPVLQAQASPFVGRWDFNITQSNGKQAAVWLGIQEKGAASISDISLRVATSSSFRIIK
jgi:hypothetical protein